jgi:predicted RNase H-like HicB family nuclease
MRQLGRMPAGHDVLPVRDGQSVAMRAEVITQREQPDVLLARTGRKAGINKMKRFYLRNNHLFIDVCVEPDGDGFHAWCPAHIGLHTCGATEAEALENARNAIIAYQTSELKHMGFVEATDD